MPDTTTIRRGTKPIVAVVIACLFLLPATGLFIYFLVTTDVGGGLGPAARTTAVGNCVPETTGAADDRDTCIQRGCVWRPKLDGAPNCTFPTPYGYRISELPVETSSGFTARLKRIPTPTLFDNDVDNLAVDVAFETNHRVRIRITDADNERYEVPKEAVDIASADVSPASNDLRLYDVEWVSEPQFGLRVIRRSTRTVVFSTTTPGFVYSDQYIQLTTELPSDHVYGLGEHNHRRLKHDMNWEKWTIFTRDVAPVDEWNLYGAQTLYTNVESDGNANGVFLLNSNAMDVVLQPKPFPAVTYHVIGGILDFFVFLGPTPENVVQQYTQAVGRPLMPPYWALGFHLSRWDYHNLTHVRNVVERNRRAGIPQDVQYGDIDYMDSKLDFTYDKVLYNGLPDFVDELHEKGQKYVIILDHALGCNETFLRERFNGSVYAPYEDGVNQGIFIRDPRNSSRLLIGQVWPGISVYPDFTLGESVTSWWTRHCRHFWNKSDGGWGVEFDALWIDMNEPSNFVAGSVDGCERNKYNYPAYVPNVLGASEEGKLYDKTICMDAQQRWGLHYNVHSLYGHSMAITTFRTLRELFPAKRPLVLTRSNFAGTQKYATHWLGDNQSQWPQMAWSIVGMLEYSLFGFSFTGADICGFWFKATEQMCQRWTQLGAFYPYARNHNGAGWPDQDPAAFSRQMVLASRDVLLIRYKLLPFLYTLLHSSHVNGNTVARPLFHEFHSDATALSIDRQFLWGPSLLVSPVLEENVNYVNAYFPQGRWYDYYGGQAFDSSGRWRNLSTPADRIQLHVRGGYIIPWQTPANTTAYSRLNAMGLLVAMSSAPQYTAHGSLFWDDGESFETFQNNAYLMLEFQCSQHELEMKVSHSGYRPPSSVTLDRLDVWGLDRQISQLSVDGQPMTDSHVVYYSDTKNTRLVNLGLNIVTDHKITWQLLP